MKTLTLAQAVKRNPAMYLPYGRATPEDFAAMLLSDAMMLDAPRVSGARWGDWWVVASDTDWIAPYLAVTSVRDYFDSLSPPIPRHDNQANPAAIVAAMASEIITLGPEGETVIKGDVSAHDLIWSYVKSDRTWNRVIAFRAKGHASATNGD
jgi:hypothetical protein